MKRLLSLFLPLLAVLFLIFYTKIHYRPESPEITLSKTFNSSGAQVVSSEIYFWGRLGGKNTENTYINQLAESYRIKLGIINDSRYTVKATENDEVRKVEIRGTDKDGNIYELSVQTGKLREKTEDNYVSVSVTKDLSSLGLVELKKKVADVYREYGIRPKVNICLTGSFDGKLDNDRLDEISRSIIKESNARKVEGIRDRNLISVSAYSPFIDDSIRVNGKEINLNLAIRYNALENKTYIWLATPVITVEY